MSIYSCIYIIIIVNLLNLQLSNSLYQVNKGAIIRRHNSRLSGSILDSIKEKLGLKEPAEIKTEEDLLFEELNLDKPWRAPKVRYLDIEYRPCKDNWKERYRKQDDDTIYIYSIPNFTADWDKTKVDDLWYFPWLWSKIKVERLSWIHKIFYSDCEAMRIQDHIEIDAMFSEFDMPVRWGILRIKEIDFLIGLSLNVAFFTDFNWIQPTDSGIRPDGSVRTCSVQYHDCISSSNFIDDNEHYAPPFVWSRSKSPEQAYDEVKDIYLNYPKRGLRWSYGWIDRGGWRPQQFNGPYFYAQADSLLFHLTDDIELVMDFDKRQVQYRSSSRLKKSDSDTQRLRYNQFVRMMKVKGGWDVQPLPKLNWDTSLPFRLTQSLLDTSYDKIDTLVQYAFNEDATSTEGPPLSMRNIMKTSVSSAVEIYNALSTILQPYIQPVVTAISDEKEALRLDPRIAAAVQTLNDFEARIVDSANNLKEITSTELQDIVERFFKLLPDIKFISPVKEDGMMEEGAGTFSLIGSDVEVPSSITSIPMDSNDVQVLEDKTVVVPLVEKPVPVSEPVVSVTNEKYKQYMQYFMDRGRAGSDHSMDGDVKAKYSSGAGAVMEKEGRDGTGAGTGKDKGKSKGERKPWERDRSAFFREQSESSTSTSTSTGAAYSTSTSSTSPWNADSRGAFIDEAGDEGLMANDVEWIMASQDNAHHRQRQEHRQRSNAYNREAEAEDVLSLEEKTLLEAKFKSLNKYFV